MNPTQTPLLAIKWLGRLSAAAIVYVDMMDETGMLVTATLVLTVLSVSRLMQWVLVEYAKD